MKPVRDDGPVSLTGERLCLTISPQVSSLLDKLLATGLYGRNRAHVAQGLLYKALRGEESVRIDLQKRRR